MDKKVGMPGRGGGEFPLRLRELALLLSFLVVLLIPFNAFGYGTVDGNFGCTVTVFSTDKVVYYDSFTSSDDRYFIYDTSSYKQPDLNKIILSFRYKYDIKKGDVMSYDFVMARGRYRGFSFNVDAYGETNVGNKGKTFFKNSGTVDGDTEFTDGDLTYDYSFSSQANSSNTFHFENTAPFSYNGFVNVTIVLEDFDYTFSSSQLPTVNLGVEVRDISASVESPESGQGKKLLSGLSAIIDYIKEIFTSIGELPSKIGNFISSLGDKISGLFTNLTNNIKGWFADVGKWFSDLGKNIQQWFTNLVNNLKTWFDNIGQWFKDIGDRIGGFFTTIWNNTVEFFTNLFKPSDDYFDRLREDLDNHMSVHLGAVYNVPKELIRQLTSIVNGLKGSNANHLYLSIPDIEFTLNGKRHVLVEAARYDLLSFVSSMPSAFKSIYNVVLVIMHGMIDLALALACFKMIYRKIINKVGIEGGDEL